MQQLMTCLARGEQPMESSVTMETDQDTSQTATATEDTTENTLPTMLV